VRYHIKQHGSLKCTAFFYGAMTCFIWCVPTFQTNLLSPFSKRPPQDALTSHPHHQPAIFMRVHLKISCSIGSDVTSNDKMKEAVAVELKNCTGT
jgi:hypothetical protein